MILRPAPSEALQAVFETGHEVGEVACRRFPGGHLVAHDHLHVPQALEETRQVIEAGVAPAVFEAAFEHERVLVRADVIERLQGGGWRLFEVKSTTRLKDVFLLDLAVQLWVLRGAGLDVREAAVLTLDRSYVYDGVRLDLDALFTMHPLLDEAGVHLDAVGEQVPMMQGMLAEPRAPDIVPGGHCFIPYSLPLPRALHAGHGRSRARHRRAAEARGVEAGTARRRGCRGDSGHSGGFPADAAAAHRSAGSPGGPRPWCTATSPGG